MSTQTPDLSPLDPEWQPDGDILTALDGIPDEDPVRVPTFTPRDAIVREPMFAENRAAVLEHVRDSVEAIDFDTLDAARANGQSYAAVLTAASGALPVRVPGASLGPAAPFDAFAGAGRHAPIAPEPEADSTWLLDFLGDLLDDAAEGAGRRIGEPCESCKGTPLSGWCEECLDALARAARYGRLAELIEAAPSDRAAVLVLMAGVWRQTAPEDAPVAAQAGTERIAR